MLIQKRFLFVLALLLLFDGRILAYNTYNIGDYIFYDPVNENESNEDIKPFDGKYPYEIVLVICCSLMLYVIVLSGSDIKKIKKFKIY